MNVITLPGSAQRDGLSISQVGVSAVLIDVTADVFCEDTQERFWSLAAALTADTELPIREVVPGVNNLLVAFDALELSGQHLQDTICRLWTNDAVTVTGSREIDIPVIYGGSTGEDLPMLAQAAGMTVEAWVACHSCATYQVACLGSMPGFAYMSGLPPQLTFPRRETPRTQIAKGAVIVGGAQAGVMPCASPSGWHVVGHTDREFFNPHLNPPCLLMPGDIVRFVNKGWAL